MSRLRTHNRRALKQRYSPYAKVRMMIWFRPWIATQAAKIAWEIDSALLAAMTEP